MAQSLDCICMKTGRPSEKKFHLKPRIMKKYILFLATVLLSATGMRAAAETAAAPFWNYYNGQAYIFVEGGVEFSVFPDGQFDFVFVGPNRGRVNVGYNSPGVNISFNGGYNYDRYVQYDDYGAVIQIENIPIYYDHYGRIIQAGNVLIHYSNRRIVRIGGYRIIYDRWGYFDYGIGSISVFFPRYVYRPWHVFYTRPWYPNCVVYDYPYRQYYRPFRYDYAYHRTNYNRGRRSYANGRREFHRPGSRIHYKDGRVARNRNFDPDRENTMIARSNRREVKRSDRTTNSRGIARTDSSPKHRERTRPARDNSIYRDGNSRGTATRTNRPSSARNKERMKPAIKKDKPRNINRNRPSMDTKPSSRRLATPNNSRMSKANTSRSSSKMKKATSNQIRGNNNNNRSGRGRAGRKID